MSQDVKNRLALTSTNDLLHALPKATLEALAAELETLIYGKRLEADGYYAVKVVTGKQLRFNSVSEPPLSAILFICQKHDLRGSLDYYSLDSSFQGTFTFERWIGEEWFEPEQAPKE